MEAFRGNLASKTRFINMWTMYVHKCISSISSMIRLSKWMGMNVFKMIVDAAASESFLWRLADV